MEGSDYQFAVLELVRQRLKYYLSSWTNREDAGNGETAGEI